MTNEERFQQWLDSGPPKQWKEPPLPPQLEMDRRRWMKYEAPVRPSWKPPAPLSEPEPMTWGQRIWAALLLFGPLAFLLAMDAQRPPIHYGEDLLGWLTIEFFIFLFGFLGIARQARERIYEEKREDDHPRGAHDG